MFVRNVAIHLKANALGEFTRIFDNEVLPSCESSLAFGMKSPFPLRRPGWM